VLTWRSKFEVDDAELDWTYPEDYFDFVHFRGVAQGIAKWPEVLKDAYRCLKPGGYVELSELSSEFSSSLSRESSDPFSVLAQCDDGSLAEDNALTRWGTLVCDAMIATGREPPSEEILRERLQKAGYVDVQTFTLHLPSGPWAKDQYEPWIARHFENGKCSPQCLNRALKKLGVMSLLSCQTGFHAYGTYAAECLPGCGD
jgi:SAM-dependent methyltransferase